MVAHKYIYMLEDGRFRVRIRKDGQTFDRVVSHLRDAKRERDAALLRFKRGYVDGRHDASDITLETIIDRYRDFFRENGRPISKDKDLTLNVVKQCLGSCKMRQVTEKRLLAHIRYRIAPDDARRPVLSSTAAKDLKYLATVLKFAQNKMGCDVDPEIITQTLVTMRNDLKLRTKSSERRRRLVGNEAELILDYFKNCKSKIPLADLFIFSCITSMRRGEVLGLLWDDLNVHDKTILVRGRKDPSAPDGTDGVVPLFNGSFEIVMRQPKTSEKIFPYKPGSVSAGYKRATQFHKIKNLRWHDLRRQAISAMFENRLDMALVQVMSGHKTLEMLKRYTNINPSVFHDLPNFDTL